MDLAETLKKKIESLPEAEYTSGLLAVSLHIETAFRHLVRGQEEDDDTAFTDAIYRCNQAFEGSIKEAFRVLADMDPSRRSPHEIEQYLQENTVLRERVLSQFTNYRTEWRNPSTHDYKLDFDESEAFLAIISVTAFACVMIDQISERVSYVEAQAEVSPEDTSRAEEHRRENNTLEYRVAHLLKDFASSHEARADKPRRSEVQFLGAAAGFINALDKSLDVSLEPVVDGESKMRPDLIVSNEDEKVVVEFKRATNSQKDFVVIRNGVASLERYLRALKANRGLLFLYGASDVEIEESNLGSDSHLKILVVRPSKVHPNKRIQRTG